MNQCDKLLRKCHKSNSEEDRNAYGMLKCSCTSEIRKARSTYHQTLSAETKKSPERFLEMENMKSNGVNKLVLTWFTDYLFQRSQVVKLGRELSGPGPLTRGVPQGSILGPINIAAKFFLLFDVPPGR